MGASGQNQTSSGSGKPGPEQTSPAVRSPTRGQLGPLRAGGRNEVTTVGAAPGVGSDPLQSLFGPTSTGFRDLLTTGFGFDTSGQRDAIGNIFNEQRAMQSADLRERLGGLGLRFSTDVNRAEQQLQSNLTGQEAAITTGLESQAFENAAGRRTAAIGQALQLPGQIQGLSQQGDAANNLLLQLAQAFATGFAPVGTSGSSKSRGVSVLGG